MADWKKVVIQAVSYIIASGLIISGFNIFYNDFYNKPHIKLDFKEDVRSAKVVVKNDGTTPARNFVLTLETPQNMTKESPQIFTTVNLSKTTEMSLKSFKVYVTMLPNGEGSIIEIDMEFPTRLDPTSSNYVVYATYDQGSIRTILPQKPLTIGEMVVDFWNSYGIAIVLIVVGLVVLPLIWLFWLAPFHAIVYRLLVKIVSFSPRISISREPRFKSASEILDFVMNTHYTLSSGTTENHVYYATGNWYKIDGKTRRQLFNNNMKDYLLIEDFFKKLNYRHSLIGKASIQEILHEEPVEGVNKDLKKINDEILILCNYIILEVDWTKYS